MNLNELPDMTTAYQEVQDKKKAKDDKKPKRWQDDDGDGNWYEKGEVDGKFKKEETEIDHEIDEVEKQLRDSGLFSEEELARLDEISADKLLDASKAADKDRGKKAVAGDKAGAAKRVKQASKFYAASAAKRKAGG